MPAAIETENYLVQIGLIELLVESLVALKGVEAVVEMLIERCVGIFEVKIMTEVENLIELYVGILGVQIVVEAEVEKLIELRFGILDAQIVGEMIIEYLVEILEVLLLGGPKILAVVD